MRFVIQRVSKADVTIKEEVVGKIGKGFLVLIGIGEDDDEHVADKMIRKLIGMRIFADETGKTNLSLKDVDGGLLLISQFTLYADCKRGNRPGFSKAGKPDQANELYEYIIKQCQCEISDTQRGQFGADMQVSLVNDGPFTIVLDSKEL